MNRKITNFYELLQLNRTATLEEIKKAFKKLAFEYHEDRNPNKLDWAKENMQKLNEAYSILKDSAKRTEYDLKLDAFENERKAEANRNSQTGKGFNLSKSQFFATITLILVFLGVLSIIIPKTKD